MLMRCADCGDVRACRWLAEFWLGRQSVRPPFVSYRNAAEYALAFRHSGGEDVLRECFEKCSPGELDDIKFRRTGVCKNYDAERGICLVSGESSECKGHGDVCDGWILYVPVPHVDLTMLRESSVGTRGVARP